MQTPVIVTYSDYNKIMGLIENASAKVKLPHVTDKLFKRLSDAVMMPGEKIEPNVVTMNSRVILKELSSGRRTEITVTYPAEAEPSARRVSVFSEIGVALIGRQAGDNVSWKVPKGTGYFQILEVTYQPEAAGDFNL